MRPCVPREVPCILLTLLVTTHKFPLASPVFVAYQELQVCSFPFFVARPVEYFHTWKPKATHPSSGMYDMVKIPQVCYKPHLKFHHPIPKRDKKISLRAIPCVIKARDNIKFSIRLLCSHSFINDFWMMV